HRAPLFERRSSGCSRPCGDGRGVSVARRVRAFGADAHDHPARAGDRSPGSGPAGTATAREPPGRPEARAGARVHSASPPRRSIRDLSHRCAGVASLSARTEATAEAGPGAEAADDSGPVSGARTGAGRGRLADASSGPFALHTTAPRADGEDQTRLG